MLIDKNGRLFGRISIVDLMIGLAALFLLSAVQFGWTIARHRGLAIYRVLPDPVIPGEQKQITILGTGFGNGCKVYLGRNMQEQLGRSVNEAVLEADPPDDLEPGTYSIWVRDSLGRFVQFPDGLRIRWNPRIDGVEPRRTYAGNTVQIHGAYFDLHAAVRLGDIPLHPASRDNSNRLAIKFEAAQPIPPGTYDVTVSNPGGGSCTLPRAIEILAKPRVTRVYPDRVTLGERVLLTLEGENLPRDASFYLEGVGRPLGEMTWLSSERIRVALAVNAGLSDWYDLSLQIPDGSKIVVRPRAIYVASSLPMLLLVHLDMGSVDPETLESLRQMPESRIRGPMKETVLRFGAWGKRQKISSHTGLWMALNGRYQVGKNGPTFFYRDQVLQKGWKVEVQVFGHPLSARLIEPPLPINTSDEWQKAMAESCP